MIPIIPLIIRFRLLSTPPTWLRRKWFQPGKIVLLPVAAAFMTLSSCNDEETTKSAPQVTVTDTEPVGAGLTVIGFAIVGASVVAVLGRLLR